MARVLDIGGISKHYGGIRALKGVGLSLNAGEIHGLCGENGSGKSTLVRLLTGTESPDEAPEATFYLQGRKRPFGRPLPGIEAVYQDLALFPELTVFQNILLSDLRGRNGFLLTRAPRKRAEALIRRYDLTLPLDSPLKDLPFAQQQLTALVRALFRDPPILLLDEPTSGLPEPEARQVFRIMQDWRARGKSLLFISHKLDQVLALADRITVLRNGAVEGCYRPEETDETKLIYAMSGKELLLEPFPPQPSEAPLLEAENLVGRTLRGVSFTLRRGEIIGLAGRLGSGRTELARSLFGLSPLKGGRVLLEGEELPSGSPRRASAEGIAFVPEDRIREGLITSRSIRENLGISCLEELRGPLGLVSREEESNLVRQWIGTLDIRAPHEETRASALSGGNQQKTVLAKWLATEPAVLILDQPTAGIDTATRNGIYQLITLLAARGMGVIWISDDFRELTANANRILIMREGRIAERAESGELSPEELHRRVRQL